MRGANRVKAPLRNATQLTTAAGILTSPARAGRERSAPADRQLGEQGLERPGGDGEPLGPAEAAVTLGQRQVRLERHESLESGVAQRGQRLAHLAVALPGR